MKTRPNQQKSGVIIIGADSDIGAKLIRGLNAEGYRVWGTTRRRNRVTQRTLFLDLSSATPLPNAAKWPDEIGIAIFCAGITRLNACQNNPQITGRVNVLGVSHVMTQLIARGLLVIYLSSDRVFDGTVPHAAPHLPLTPITAYGSQKAAVENHMAVWPHSTAIVRLTKVMSSDAFLFDQWHQAFSASKKIYPFNNRFLAPVPVDFVIQALIRIIDSRSTGIFQISGKTEVSYAQAAYLIADTTGGDPSLIDPVDVKAAHLLPPPGHATLDTTRIEQDFGLIPPAVETTIIRTLSSPPLLKEQ